MRHSGLAIRDAVTLERNERDRAQSEVERLDAALAALGNLDGTNRVRVGGQTRRHLSAVRHRISLAQKKRWALSKAKATKKHWSQLPQNKARVLQMVRHDAQHSTPELQGCLDYKCNLDNQELLRETEKWIQIKFCLVADRVSKQIAFTCSCSFLASSMARKILIGVLSGFVPVSCSSAARRF